MMFCSMELHYIIFLYCILSMRCELYDRFCDVYLTLIIVHGCLAHLSAHYFLDLVRESWAVVTSATGIPFYRKNPRDEKTKGKKLP